MVERITIRWRIGALVIAGAIGGVGASGFAEPEPPEAPPAEPAPTPEEQPSAPDTPPSDAPDHDAPAELPPTTPAPDSDATSGRIAEDLSRTTFTAPVYRADDMNGSGAATRTTPAVPLLPEGAFLSERRGILVPVGERDWGFVFDPDAQGVAERPMLLQPCLRLAEMVRLRASTPETATFVVSGHVMMYGGVNVLMPEEARLFPMDRPDSGADAEAKVVLDANRALDPSTPDPSIDDLLARIEQARGDQDRGMASAAVEDAVAQARGDLKSEGEMIVSQRGRIVRGPGGQLAFVQETDTGPLRPRGGNELILLRSRNLEAIERAWQRSGDQLSVTVSGPVTVFEGSNFLLPLMFVIEPARGGEITSAQ